MKVALLKIIAPFILHMHWAKCVFHKTSLITALKEHKTTQIEHKANLSR